MSKIKTSIKGIYTDFDTIYDTRLPLISMIDNEVAMKVVETDYYHNRLIDEFDWISNKIFKYYYRLRGNKILKYSFFSRAIELILISISNLKLIKVETDDRNLIKLVINTYPYRVSRDVLDNLTIYLIDKVGEAVDIEYIRMNPYDIKSSYLINNFNTAISYNGLDMVKSSMENINKISDLSPSFTWIVPMLLEEPIVMREANDYIELFSSISKSMEDFYNIEFVEVEMFSIVK